MSADLVGAVWGHTRPDLGQTEQDVRFRTDDPAFATMEGIDGSEMILISIPIIPTAAGSCGAAERRLGVHHRLEQAT